MNLLRLPRKSITAFINNTDKKIYITYSSSTLSYLFSTLRLLERLRHHCTSLCNDINKLDFIILETFDDYTGNELGRYRLKYWVDQYVSMGYSLYQPVKHLDFKCKLEVHPVSKNHKDFKVFLYLVHKRYCRIMIQKFDTFKDAEAFISDKSIEQLLRTRKVIFPIKKKY